MSEFPEIDKKLSTALGSLDEEFRRIRTGRPQAGMIEDIAVDYYGTHTPIKGLGTISVLDAQTLMVEPWDKNALEAIAGAIEKSGTGLRAVVTGDRVRVPFPALSEERRREFIKLASKKAEETKVRVRQIRDEEMKELNRREKDKEIGEDEKFRTKEKLERIFKEHSDKIEQLLKKKEQELLSI
jgi:ribosome recycling factor